jgi:hypothetical protein
MVLETPEKAAYVPTRRIVIQHLIDQSVEVVIIHNGQHAKGAIVQFVGRDTAGKVRKHPLQVVALDGGFSLFSPWPQSSS